MALRPRKFISRVPSYEQTDAVIVPIAVVFVTAAAGHLSANFLKNRTLKTHKDLPHGMPTTQAETINPDLLAFIKR